MLTVCWLDVDCMLTVCWLYVDWPCETRDWQPMLVAWSKRMSFRVFCWSFHGILSVLDQICVLCSSYLAVYICRVLLCIGWGDDSLWGSIHRRNKRENQNCWFDAALWLEVNAPVCNPLVPPNQCWHCVFARAVQHKRYEIKPPNIKLRGMGGEPNRNT